MHALKLAHHQWANRPADERFWTLTDMQQAAQSQIGTAVPATNCKPTAVDGRPVLLGPHGQPAEFTHWSFGQLATRLGAPAAYLRELPAELAIANLQHGMRQHPWESSEAYLHADPHTGTRTLRALTSTTYQRVHDTTVIAGLLELQEHGWRVPPGRPVQPGRDTRERPATEADVLRNAAHPTLGVKVGDPIAPAGLYLGDRDMFAFLIDDSRPIRGPNGDPLYRAVMVSNSEVGASSLSMTLALIQSVCGNHILWGVERSQQIRLHHVGRVAARWHRQALPEVTYYQHSFAAPLEIQLACLAARRIAPTPDQTIERVHQRGLVPKATLEAAVTLCTQHSDGDPCTPWGLAAGLTRHSQTLPYAGARSALDRQAAKILAARW